MTVTMLNFKTISQHKMSRKAIRDYANTNEIVILHACWATQNGKGFKLQKINKSALKIN